MTTMEKPASTWSFDQGTLTVRHVGKTVSLHQAWEDHREASAEGSDNVGKAYAKGLATVTAAGFRRGA
jgi:hypothetical protein